MNTATIGYYNAYGDFILMSSLRNTGCYTTQGFYTLAESIKRVLIENLHTSNPIQDGIYIHYSE